MAETEKITINMGAVDLGQIDLLVDEGFYSNRTDFIRTAIRNQLSQHKDGMKQILTRKSMALGAIGYNRQDLERYLDRGEQLEIKAVGLFVLQPDISPELARRTIKSIKVFGVFQANEAVKEALKDRIL